MITSKVRKVAIDNECLRGLAFTLWGFLIFALLLEGIEFGALVYRGREGIEVIMEFVRGRLYLTFFVLQFLLGSLLPLLVLTFIVWRGVSGRKLVVLATGCAVLVMFAVLMMRYNVVIGGQEISKTGRGLLTYEPVWLGREGLLAAGFVLVAPFLLMFIATRFVSPWMKEPLARSAT